MAVGIEKNLEALGACCRAFAATPARLARPRRPDAALLASITDVGAPKPRATVRLTALPQAKTSAPAAVVAEGVRRPLRLRFGMTTFLVEHEKARFLVDPAICRDVHETVLRRFPLPFRVTVAPEKPVLPMTEVLRRVGMAPWDVDFALPTHLHWDHVSGLAELPGELPVHVRPVERGFASPVANSGAAPLGTLGDLLDGRNVTGYELDGPPVLTFERSHDVFGDGSVVLVDLAGHTPGSVGVLLAVSGGRRVLLAGDAVWHGLQVRTLREKAPFPGDLVDADRDATFATLHRLHALPDDVTVLPAHDRDAAMRWCPGTGRS